MTTERLVTEYTSDTRGFRRGAQIYDQTLARQERLTNERLSRIDNRWARSTRSILNTRTALGGLSTFIGARGLAELRNYAEAWRDVGRRLQSIGVVSEQGQKGLVGLALRTRSAVQGTASIVQRFQKSTGADIDTTTRRVETLQKLLATNGATGTERTALGVQLGQALQSGVLSGDEFRTIRENAPIEFLDALAAAAGVTRKELKATAEDQKLTTEVVLRALDALASTADAKFGALAMSGDEAFNILSTGLTVYVGNVDQALGATETINGAMAWLGEYLTDAGEGAEWLATAIQIVGAAALAVAGSRGIGALNGAVQRSAETARFAAQEAQKEVAASQKKVAAAQKEVAASRALVAQRQSELSQRMQANRKQTKAVASLEAAQRKQARAVTALAGAEARAVVATDRLTAAQGRLTFAARASAAALRTVRSVLAFFGGPLGLAITAFAALPLLIKDVDERLADLRGVSDEAMQSMDRYAEVSKRAGEEQEKLGGKVSKATQALLTQSRVEMQSSLRKLREEQTKLLDDIRGNGIFDNSEISGPLSRLRSEYKRQIGQYGGSNSFLEETIAGLEDLQNGTADLQALEQALTNVRAVGDEAFAAWDAFGDAIANGADIEGARASLLAYAESAGIFEDQIRAINEADGPFQTEVAFRNLSLAVFDAGKASEIMGKSALDALSGMVSSAAEADLVLQYLVASLEGNKKEAARIKAELENAAIAAGNLGNSRISPPITAAANEAERLARNLAAAREQRIDGITGGNKDFFDPRNEGGNRGRIFRNRPVPPQNRPGYEPPRTGGGGGGGSGAERDLSAARELLIKNGHKALYVERQLNAERQRLRELLPQLISLGLTRADAEKVINSELARTEENLKRVKTAGEQAAEALAKGIMSDIRHADSLSDALGRIGDRLWDLALDPVFEFLGNQLAGLGTGGGGGFLSTLFGFLFNANGNAFNQSGVIPFANGGVVDRPTFFRFGGGRTGVMGEAGAEGIFPLRRGRDGKLGVIAQMPTLPTLPKGPMQANATFNWLGDMVITSNSDQPQQVGAEVTDQMRAMFNQMFDQQIGNAMRAGGVLDQKYQKNKGI